MHLDMLCPFLPQLGLVQTLLFVTHVRLADVGVAELVVRGCLGCLLSVSVQAEKMWADVWGSFLA